MAITVVVSQSSSKNMIKIIDKNSRARVEGVAYYKPHPSERWRLLLILLEKKLSKINWKNLLCQFTWYVQ